MNARSDDGPGKPGPFTWTQDVLERYRSGDGEAERQLFERCRSMLVRRAQSHPRLRAIRHEFSAEDAAHEVLWRALSSGMLERFEHRGKGSLDAALLLVLDRTLVDMGRRLAARKRGGGHSRVLEPRPDGESTSGLERLPANDVTPTADARARELVEIAERELSPREFRVWHLIEIAGLDSNEVGQRLGITASAVRGLLFRAQARLVRTLGTERPGPGLRSPHE